jgi:hypothetical protein
MSLFGVFHFDVLGKRHEQAPRFRGTERLLEKHGLTRFAGAPSSSFGLPFAPGAERQQKREQLFRRGRQRIAIVRQRDKVPGL